MDKKISASVIIDQLLALQDAYATTNRAVITKERYQSVPWELTGTSFLECQALHEPLLEHIGHLPIIATYLHPFTQYSNVIDLGRVLTMLAIHDIGETVVGDVPSFVKNSSHEQQEVKAAVEILPKQMHDIYAEYELNQSMDAKFAKSIDILAPMLHHMSHLVTLAILYRHLDADLIGLWQRKRLYMTWDSVMLQIFDYCTDTIRPTLLPSEIS